MARQNKGNRRSGGPPLMAAVAALLVPVGQRGDLAGAALGARGAVRGGRRTPARAARTADVVADDVRADLGRPALAALHLDVPTLAWRGPADRGLPLALRRESPVRTQSIGHVRPQVRALAVPFPGGAFAPGLLAHDGYGISCRRL